MCKCNNCRYEPACDGVHQCMNFGQFDDEKEEYEEDYEEEEDEYMNEICRECIKADVCMFADMITTKLEDSPLEIVCYARKSKCEIFDEVEKEIQDMEQEYYEEKYYKELEEYENEWW